MNSYKIKYDSFMSRKLKNNQEILKQNDVKHVADVSLIFMDIFSQSWCPLRITYLGHLLTLFLSGTCFFDSSPIIILFSDTILIAHLCLFEGFFVFFLVFFLLGVFLFIFGVFLSF